MVTKKTVKKTKLRLKKFFQNRYFIFRHGHSDIQTEKAAGRRPAKEKEYNLTMKGREEVSASAKKIKKEDIDLIVSSDLERARQTSEIISHITKARVVFDKRLREFDAGDLKGLKSEEIWKHLCDDDDLAFCVLPNGESFADVRKRAYGCLVELERKHKNKTIVIVSHEFPLMLLEWTLKGMEIEDIIAKRCAGKIKKMKTGSFCELCFKNCQEQEQE